MQHQNAPELPTKAKHIVTWVVGVASLAAIAAATDVRGLGADFAVWVFVALIAGAAKIRFPKVHGCYSFGYIVVIAATALLPYFETFTLAVCVALAQCYWRPRKFPSLIQAAFNTSNYAISATAAWYVRGLFSASFPEAHLAAIALAAATFFVLNSGLVAVILAALSNRRFTAVWNESLSPVVPLYVAGFAPIAIIYSRDLGVGVSLGVCLLFLPFMYFGSKLVRTEQPVE